MADYGLNQQATNRTGSQTSKSIPQLFHKISDSAGLKFLWVTIYAFPLPPIHTPARDGFQMLPATASTQLLLFTQSLGACKLRRG